MPYNNTDISHIRSLLARFYNGETSGHDEMMLRRFFTETPPDELPADLMTDRDLFLSLSGLSRLTDCGEATLPAGMAERFDRHVDALVEADGGEASGKRRRRTLSRRLSVWISSVAASLMAAWLVTGVLRFDQNRDTMTPAFAVATKAPQAEPVMVSSDTTPEATAMMNEIRLHTAKATSKARTHDGNGRAEMTPAQIDAEVSRALELVRQAMSKGLSTVEEAGNDFNEANHKTILQIEEALQVDLPGINRPISI